MIDTFSIVLSHGLLAIMVWRLLHRPDLDSEDGLPMSDDDSAEMSNASNTRRFGQTNASTQKGFRNRA